MLHVTLERACCHKWETCMFHVTPERACCHKWETNVKCLMLLTIVHAVADAAFVGDDCVDTVFTCNYHVWRALCVISASVCVGTPKYTV
jgi:hypothetical protein